MTVTATPVCRELRDLTRSLMGREPDEIRALRTGTVPLHPGSYGQYFTTWDLANGILRDYSMNVYQTVRMAADERLTVAAVNAVLETWDPIYSKYLGYSGFPTLEYHAERVRTSSFHDRGALVTSLMELTEYVNRLTAWSHHCFPWDIGASLRYQSENSTAPPHGTPPEAPTPEGDPGRRIPLRLRWDPLGVEISAYLATDLNEQLCDDVIRALPFTVLQDHAVVSGKSMYAWAPLVSVAPTPVTERICDAPVGRLRFSQATGNKLIIQYGTTTEPLRVPVLGMVAEPDRGKLDAVGRAVWESTFRTKEPIWVTAELADEPLQPRLPEVFEHDRSR